MCSRMAGKQDHAAEQNERRLRQRAWCLVLAKWEQGLGEAQLTPEELQRELGVDAATARLLLAHIHRTVRGIPNPS